MNNSGFASLFRTGTRAGLYAGASALALTALTLSSPALAQSEDLATEASQPVTANQGPIEAWGLEETDVQPDPAIRYGKLANGMRYAIRPNATPEAAASIRLHVDFGSLFEAENERGLAHFIEHMAFNGTTNVPEGEMLPMLERLGFKFGPDTNATTNFNETIYYLDIANATEERVDSALFLMRETASEILFEKGAVDRERGVISGERRARDNQNLRRIIDQIDFSAPETLYSKRLPIGTEEVLASAPAERLKALYHRYYRPENTTLVVVGDLDPDAIEAKIAEKFGDWTPTGTAGDKPVIGTVDFDRETAFDSFIDPAIPSIVQVTVQRPYSDPMDSIARRFQGQLEDLGTAMLTARLQRIAKLPDSVLINGQVLADEYETASRVSGLIMITRDGEWATGISVAEQELRRALEFGFTQAELDRTLANVESAAKQRVEQADARTTRTLANGIVGNAADNDLNTDPAWRYALFQRVKPQLTVANVNAAFRSLWTGSAPLVHVSAKELEGGTEAIKAAFAASTQVAVAAPADVKVAEFAYDKFGDGPGTVASDTQIDDLGIRTITFANNVHLNIKKTDLEPGKFSFAITVDGGLFALPGNHIGNAIFFQAAGPTMGTGEHSAQDFQDILAGKAAFLGLTATDNTFSMSNSLSPEFLDLQMKVTAAYLSDNGFRPEAQAQWDSIVGPIYGQVTSAPAAMRDLRASGALTKGDPRFSLSSQEDLSSVSQEGFREAFESNAREAAIEIAVVGDVDPDTVIAAVSQSFGALPTRRAEFLSYAEDRKVELKDKFGPITVQHAGPADQALVAAFWHTSDDSNHRDAIAMDVLSAVTNLKVMEVLRENLGTTYTPDVGSDMSDVYTDFGFFRISAIVAPADVDKTLAAIPPIIADIRDNGIDADLLKRARQPMIEQASAAKRGNSYWLAVASRAQSQTARLDRIREYDAILSGLTAEELQDVAKKYLTPDRRMDVRILSSQEATPAEAEPAE